MCRNFLRIKVAIDCFRPLKSKMRIKKAGGDWLWIPFKYERLPSFCFYCDKIGRTKKFCDDMFDNAHGQVLRKYDSSLRGTTRESRKKQGKPVDQRAGRCSSFSDKG